MNKTRTPHVAVNFRTPFTKPAPPGPSPTAGLVFPALSTVSRLGSTVLNHCVRVRSLALLRSPLGTVPSNTTPGHCPSRGAQLPGPSAGSALLRPRYRAGLLPLLSADLSSTAPPQRCSPVMLPRGYARLSERKRARTVTVCGTARGLSCPCRSSAGHGRGDEHCRGHQGVTSKQGAVRLESTGGETEVGTGNRGERERGRLTKPRVDFEKVNRIVHPVARLTKKNRGEARITKTRKEEGALLPTSQKEKGPQGTGKTGCRRMRPHRGWTLFTLQQQETENSEQI